MDAKNKSSATVSVFGKTEAKLTYSRRKMSQIFQWKNGEKY